MTGMIEWGQKSKPKKVPGPKFNPQKSHAEFLSQKHFLKALNDMTIMNLYIVLNTPKNPYLNQATQKMLAKIFLPKKILKSKISNPKKFFHHPCHGVPSLGIMSSVFSRQSSVNVQGGATTSFLKTIHGSCPKIRLLCRLLLDQSILFCLIKLVFQMQASFY